MSVRCGHCCIANEGCQPLDTTAIPCPNCIPKWRCLTETFEPDLYSEACPSTHKAKMAYDCESSSYVIVRYPVNPDMPVEVSVNFATRTNVDGKTECYYQVHLAHPDGETVTVDVELSDLSNPIEYSIDGGTYTIEIGGKVGVCLPLAEAQCSPCRVYTCIPERLLITLTLDDDEGCVRGGQEVSFTADWEDTAYIGSLTIGEDEVTAVATPLLTQCGFNVVIDGIPGSGVVEPFDVLLESGITPIGEPCEKYSSIRNELAVGESVSAVTHRGRGECEGSVSTSLIYATFSITDYNGNAIGNGSIQDGDCVVTEKDPVYRACCFGVESLCPYSDYLHLGVIAPDCAGGLDGFATTLKNWATSAPVDDTCFTDGESLLWVIWNNGQLPSVREIQCGPVGECGPLFIEFWLSCCFPPPNCPIYQQEDAAKYRLWVKKALYDSTPVEASLVFASCDPFILEFEMDATWDVGGNCDCCVEGGTMTIRITK